MADDVQAAIKSFAFPLEYHAEVLADVYGAAGDSAGLSSFAGIMALIGIFLLLQASFRSWRLALVTFLTLPAALAGGVLAALLGGSTLAVSVLLAGLLAVLGIAVRNSV